MNNVSKRIDLTGNLYGRLTVIGYDSTNRTGKALWRCECNCGNTTVVIGDNLKTGATTSCGCYRKEVEVIASVTHGLTSSNGKKNRLYSIWSDMRKRCNNKNNKEFHNYGGRGIKVSDEWERNYLKFHEWAIDNGYSDDLTLDRIEVNGNYESTNCKWSTWSEQGQNKRLSPRNTSGISGVTFNKKRGLYTVRIGTGGKRIYVGDYPTIEEARNARIEAEKCYWGGDADV